MGVYENVKNILEARKITVSTFERDLGLSKGSFYKWEKHSPSVKTVKKAAEYLGVSIAKIV